MDRVINIPKTNNERMAVMETKIDNLKDIQERATVDNREDHQKIFSKIDEFIESANKNYATKKEVEDKISSLSKNIDKHKKTSSAWVDRAIIYLIALINLIVLFIKFK